LNSATDRRAGDDPLSQTLSALAHPVRRELLDIVRGGPARVTELAARFEISLPAVSRHVRVLGDAGLVERRIVGRDHFIGPSHAGLDDVAAWVERRSGEWRRRLDALKALMEGHDG
jgi:DNA-binding transcriptional ArsR family regulator